MKIYCMSDIHGDLQAFGTALKKVDLSGDNMLILLGDYVHGPHDYAVIETIMDLQEKYGKGKVVALRGNHEQFCIDGEVPVSLHNIKPELEKKYSAWMRTLPLYYETDRQIFVHAGVDEDAGEYWKIGTDPNIFLSKYPAETGKFYKDIIAGHVGTGQIANNRDFHGIYYDGYSHYYIDGTVAVSRKIPVLMYDSNKNSYFEVTDHGIIPVLPYNMSNR